MYMSTHNREREIVHVCTLTTEEVKPPIPEKIPLAQKKKFVVPVEYYHCSSNFIILTDTKYEM